MAEVKIKGDPPRTFSKRELKLVFSSIGMKPRGRDVFGESGELLHFLAKDPNLFCSCWGICNNYPQWRNWLMQTLKCPIGGRWGPPHWLKE